MKILFSFFLPVDLTCHQSRRSQLSNRFPPEEYLLLRRNNPTAIESTKHKMAAAADNPIGQSSFPPEVSRFELGTKPADFFANTAIPITMDVPCLKTIKNMVKCLEMSW